MSLHRRPKQSKKAEPEPESMHAEPALQAVDAHKQDFAQIAPEFGDAAAQQLQLHDPVHLRAPNQAFAVVCVLHDRAGTNAAGTPCFALKVCGAWPTAEAASAQAEALQQHAAKSKMPLPYLVMGMYGLAAVPVRQEVLESSVAAQEDLDLVTHNFLGRQNEHREEFLARKAQADAAQAAGAADMHARMQTDDGEGCSQAMQDDPAPQ